MATNQDSYRTLPESGYEGFRIARSPEQLLRGLGDDAASFLAFSHEMARETLAAPADYGLDGSDAATRELLTAIREWGSLGWVPRDGGFHLVELLPDGWYVKHYNASGIGGYGGSSLFSGGRWYDENDPDYPHEEG